MRFKLKQATRISIRVFLKNGFHAKTQRGAKEQRICGFCIFPLRLCVKYSFEKNLIFVVQVNTVAQGQNPGKIKLRTELRFPNK
jgi:hypothetical protein